jgi:hypothetical protein
MSNIVMKTAELMELLPESDQTLAYELIRKLVLAWDPDFTKLTAAEAAQLRDAEMGEFVDEEDIDWDHLEQYAE